MLRLLRFITYSRTVNLIKLYLSFFVSRLLRKPVLWGRPFAVSIEPGTACTLHCPECPTGTGTLNRPQGRISKKMFRKIIEDMLPELTVLNLYLQGEPMMHPDITEMIRFANEKNIYTITSSNGQIFNREIAEKMVDNGLSEIYFSLDGVTQETYARYRKGGDIEKVKDSIQTLAEIKRKKRKNNPLIVAQFIVFRHNEHEVDEFRKLAKKLGADRAEIKTAQFNNFSTNEVQPPLNNRYKRYVDKNELLLKGRTYNHCWKSWMSLVFTWDLKALPCCYDKDGKYSFGEFTESNFKNIWKGDKNKMFKSMILKSKGEIDICRNCPEGRNFFI